MNKKIQSIYDSVFDLTTIFPIQSYDELKAALQEHYYNTSDKKPAKTEKTVTKKKDGSTRISTDEAPDDKDIPMEFKTAPVTTQETATQKVVEEKKEVVKKETQPTVEDSQVMALLAGLDSL